MLFALAIALSYLESLVSPLLGLMPAIKLGLSNIVVMYALLFLRTRTALLPQKMRQRKCSRLRRGQSQRRSRRRPAAWRSTE